MDKKIDKSDIKNMLKGYSYIIMQIEALSLEKKRLSKIETNEALGKRIASIIEELDFKMGNLAKARGEAEFLISLIDNYERRNIFSLRFLACETLENIEKITCFSRSAIYRHINAGIDEINHKTKYLL